jgi:hypothetical protein
VQTEAGSPKPEGGTAGAVLSLGVFKPSTLAGAMKVEIAALGTFTLEKLQNTVAEKYREEEFHKNAAANSFYGNLSYWAKTARLEKTGDGAAAAFKVLDKEFFRLVGV